MGVNRARRLWRQAGLGLPRKRPRRRVATSRPRPLPPRAANHVWAYDFVFDSCANGQQLKCLTVIDEFTHECLAVDVAGSIRSTRVIDILTRLMSVHGAPAYLRSDSGPEFVSHAILQWLTDARIETAIIDPGKPWQNGTNESFNGKFRDECLSVEWFRTRREAQVIIEAWRKHYNAVRPHSSIDYLTPHEFKHTIALFRPFYPEPFPRIDWPERADSGQPAAKRPQETLGPGRLAICLSSRRLPHCIMKMQRISEILQFPVIVERRRLLSLEPQPFQEVDFLLSHIAAE